MAQPTCWFCGKGAASDNSLCYEFRSREPGFAPEQSHFVVVPRCEGCYGIHYASGTPSYYAFVIAITLAMGIIMLVRMLPLPHWLLNTLTILIILSSFAGAIFVASGQEASRARKAGSRPEYEIVDHPGFKEFGARTKEFHLHPSYLLASSQPVKTVGGFRQYLAKDPERLRQLEEAL